MAKEGASPKELRQLPEGELHTQMDTLRQEIWQNRIKLKQGASQQTHVVRKAKRNIARIQTLLNEKRKSS